MPSALAFEHRACLLVAAIVGVAALAHGCTRTAPCQGANCIALETESGGTSESGETGETGGPSEPPGVVANRDVDILFVIDNSGSMGEEQALLAANVGAFIQVLEADGVDANYRIGVTTSDAGNPWCPAGTTTPEAGNLVMSPCTARLQDFIFNNGQIDVQDLACNDICTLSQAELEVLPTTTDYDANPAPRPWLERIEGKKNIPESTSTADAFACFGPQGINGCGFESQLESMYLALARVQNPDEASYGFMRPGAILAVVFVTDEADCSYSKDYAEIFDASGNKVFWSDPLAAFPTSAVCWNAGVECVGDPSNYDDCVSVNKDVNGNPAVPDADAVLLPMSRYLGQLQGLEDDKKNYDYDNDVIVGLIGGVDFDGQAHYADVSATDPEFQDSFGIGPGCQAPNPLDPNAPVQAVPPVRLRELVEEFTPDNMFSICANDYSPALEAIADRIRSQIKPACYTQCAADTVPETPILDAACVVEQDPPGNDNTVEVAECLRDANGYVIDPNTNDFAMPSDADNVCYAMLVDTSGLTADPEDDMSNYCQDGGFNLEFEIARRPGFPAPGGTTLSASCTLSDTPESDCPGIGG